MTLPEAPAVAVHGSRRRDRSGFAAAALVLLALLFGVSGPAVRAADDDPFTVTVPVDASADNAVNAREKARHDGEHRALAAIAERVVAGSGASPKLAKLDDNAVTNLVASFEVANERMSAVRYLADYTFHFRPAETQRVLKSAGISPNAATADAVSGGGKPAVMLPVYQAGGHAVLWDDPNPWRQAWAQLPPATGAAPLAVPLGDVGDIAAIDADKARAADAEALAAIAKKNGGDDVIVALAAARAAGKPEPTGKPDIAGVVTAPPGAPAGLDITVRRYRQGKLAEAHFAPIEAKPGENPDALLQRAAAAIAADIQTGWKQETAGKFDQRGSLTATAPITGLDDWVKLRDRLASVGTIRKVDLMALSRQEAVVQIDYLGSVDQLQASLATAGLALAREDAGGDKSWRLARSETPAPR
jgi:hypothetical protein